MAPNAATTTIDKAKKLLTVAASVATTAVLVRTVVNDVLPQQLRDYIHSTISTLFSRESTDLTVVIQEEEGLVFNQVFRASSIYVGGMVSSTTKRLRVSQPETEKHMLVTVDSGDEVVDVFEGVEFKWKMTTWEGPTRRGNDNGVELRAFEISFDRKHKDMALGRYLPYVVERSKAIMEGEKVIKLHMLNYDSWVPVNLNHPATFDTVAMEPELKRMVMDDLERFLKRKDYYKRIGKAWKRGYLLYGPPGTGKSSLVAAMANFIKFDVYDLELTEVRDNTSLRSVLLSTANKSILVVEDVDCTIQIRNREEKEEEGSSDERITLSGLLNFIDGLWSSCGDERIVVFTTNHKERLDPALLRPGRMDMHIYMGYCTPAAFRILVSNYHCVDGGHRLFPEIERLVGEVEVTPAEVAGELMKNDDVGIALGCFVNFLEDKKKAEGEKAKEEQKENKISEDEIVEQQ